MLNERYRELTTAEPRLRARDAALRLGVSEAELACGPLGGRRLRVTDWPALVAAYRSLGPVMALTRNEVAVHEREGAFFDVRMDHPHVGGVYGPDIDLRLFPSCWTTLVAVDVATPRGPRRSLQLYDRHGLAVQKLYAVADTDLAAWDALVEALGDDPTPPPAERPPAAPPRGDVDRDTLLARWAAMRDTHDLFPLMRELGLRRDRALEKVEGDFSWRVDVGALQRMLVGAAERALPIMVFVGNRGCIQIHSGPVHRVLEKDGWMNVLDHGFNLHVRLERVAGAWIVHKPTDDGIVSSLELLDADGGAAVQLFGVRKPGLAEDARWRALTDREVAGG